MMKIRQGSIKEIENFQLYNEDNKGSDIIVVEDNCAIVGYAQFNDGYDDAEIFFMEAEKPGVGIGRMIIDWFKSQYSEIT